MSPRFAVAAIAALMPFNFARVLLLRALGYRISKSRIGFGTILAVEKAEITDSNIGVFNLFCGPMTVRISACRVGCKNRFLSSEWSKTRWPSLRSGISADRVIITSGHHFDLTAEVSINAGTKIGGLASEFWTHGANKAGTIEIGRNCYVGSGVKFAPLSGLADGTSVCMGSVVAKAFDQPNILIGGVPAKFIKELNRNEHHNEPDLENLLSGEMFRRA